MENALVDVFMRIPVWLQIPLLLGGAFVAAKAIKWLSSYVLHRSARLANGEYDRIIVEEIHYPLYATVFLAGVYVSAQLIEGVTLGFYIASTALSIIVVLWAYAVVRIGSRVITATNNTPAGREITPIFKNVFTFFIVFTTFFVLLGIWEIDITPFLASAGVIGIIIGIAAQDSIGNFFGGISLYLDKTYKIGDMIQLDSGERGTVVDMSIRSTTVLTRDNIAVTIPNAEMNSTQIINESAPIRRRRIRLDVGVAYDSDLETVKQVLLEVAENERLILETPAPCVRYREFGDSAIVAQLQCHIKNPGLLDSARHNLIERIDDRFREEEIKIPFPQREVTFFEAGNTVSIDDSPPTRHLTDE